MDDLTFRVYLPPTGACVTRDRDGERTVKLRVPAVDAAGLDALVDALGAGDGTVIRLVAVAVLEKGR